MRDDAIRDNEGRAGRREAYPTPAGNVLTGTWLPPDISSTLETQARSRAN